MFNFTIIKNKLLLKLGKTLVNRHGYTVKLVNDKQVKSNPRRHTDYSMDDPTWKVLRK